MKVLQWLTLSLALVTAGGNVALAQTGGPKTAPARLMHGALAPELQGRPVVARIHADWCSACKATQATVDAVKAHYGRKIAFVQFDVTNAKTSAEAKARAQRLGLGAFFEANKTATSTVAIVNPKTGQVVANFYNDTDAVDYERSIDRVVAQLHK